MPVGLYASFVEPARLVTERAAVSLDPRRAGQAPVRVAVVADLQFDRVGDHEREAVARVMEERPDLILLTGDYHQGTPESLARELPRVRALMATLRAPGGVFAVQGDVESVAKARAVFAGTGVRLLTDGEARMRVRDRSTRLPGCA